MITKKTLMIGALIATLGAGAIGIGTTFAGEPQQERPKFLSELAGAIATKFNLKQNDVQAVIDQEFNAHRVEVQAMHEQKFDEMLAKAVTDGKLTQTQADAIKTKRNEIKAYAESLASESQEQREADMKIKIDALRDWAKTNNIPEQFIRFGPPMRRG